MLPFALVVVTLGKVTPGSALDPPVSLIAQLPSWATLTRSRLAAPTGRQPSRPLSKPGLPTRLPAAVVTGGAVLPDAIVELAAGALVACGAIVVAAPLPPASRSERDPSAL